MSSPTPDDFRKDFGDAVRVSFALTFVLVVAVVLFTLIREAYR